MGCSTAQSSVPSHIQEPLCFTLACLEFLSHLRVNKNLDPFFLCTTPPSLVVRMHSGTQPAFVTSSVPCWLMPRPVGRPHSALLVSDSCWGPFESASPIASFGYTKLLITYSARQIRVFKLGNDRCWVSQGSFFPKILKPLIHSIPWCAGRS